MVKEKITLHNTIFQLITNLQSWLDDGQYAGLILMDLSKAYDCILYDLLLAKLQAHGTDEKSVLFIYRVINHLSLELISESFKEKTTKYSLHSNSTLQLPRLQNKTMQNNQIWCKHSYL